ncbi:hypothetical protein Pyrde_1391 [Pyrodictium delaneyi]|uniref:HTH arsR-type domain-containing protein n=1 Tax=Pyrodictium delaneyi TaxID=1273541 RepID=A0A0P0N3C0_9CREN|nr:helix-turn-helix domain-containing protein [Pyrodictium delaneyi]ALL01437.1 hypothetical protein Pyrde_1391 [Pyrodictium delaneyi]
MPDARESIENGDIDAVLQALGHPLRRRIVEALAESGEMSYAELMRRVGIDDSGTFAFHLRRLRGLVEKDEKRGVYRLTQLGLRAYQALQLVKTGVAEDVRTNESRATDEHAESRRPSREEIRRPHGKKALWVISDRTSFRLTREHLERALRRGKKILLTDIATLVVEPVPEELFEEAVHAVVDVARVYAPEYLRAVLDEKMHDVLTVKYYDPSEGVPQPGLLETLIEALSSLISKAVEAAAIARGMGKQPVEVDRVFSQHGEELRLRTEACSLRVLPGNSSVIRLHGRSRGEPFVEAIEAENGLAVSIRGSRETKLQLDLPPKWPRRLALEARAAGVKATDLELEKLSIKASASALMIAARLVGDNPAADIACSTGALQIDFKGDWRGEALVSLRLGASSAKLELVVPRDVRVAVETQLSASSASIMVDGKRVHGGFQEPGYEEAKQKLRIIVEGTASSAKVNIRRLED